MATRYTGRKQDERYEAFIRGIAAYDPTEDKENRIHHIRSLALRLAATILEMTPMTDDQEQALTYLEVTVIKAIEAITKESNESDG